ncbi:hypothetical protein B0H10DRAFT_2201811 [Mycena sp. CBHHK59/15]|nr:hypothetical protein B0H10DRAFT_2201811 [Mycena sp. CBHHK59/15]
MPISPEVGKPRGVDDSVQTHGIQSDNDLWDGVAGTWRETNFQVESSEGFAENVVGNEEVQTFESGPVGVRMLMSELETISEIHPFVRAAYLPFQLIHRLHHQETQHRDNDQKKTILFEKIKDVMLVLCQLKNVSNDDTRTTPEGQSILRRLASICEEFEKRSLSIKFLKAASWNKELASYAARFTIRREELSFAFSMRSLVTLEEMNAKCDFPCLTHRGNGDLCDHANASGKRPGTLDSAKRGEMAVLSSDSKCAAMIRYESILAKASGPTARTDKGRFATMFDVKKMEEKATILGALKKEYREDIRVIIQENMERYSQRFEIVLDDMIKDLGNNIQHEGDRMIEYPTGSSRRIQDKDEVKNHPTGNVYLSLTADSKLLPPTQGAAGSGLEGMWHDIKNRDVSRSDKVMDGITDTASGAVNMLSSSNGVDVFQAVKSVVANDKVQAFGKAVLEGVPALMRTLETISQVHPFLKAAYLPFQLIYHQETQRRDNDEKRTTLFKKIKDVMLVLSELQSFPKDDARTTPTGEPVLGRLASICKDMHKDIEDCYNVLNAQEKRSLGIKFLKAGSWNKELGSFAARFTTRREELSFALSMRSAVTLEEMNANMQKMMAMFVTMLSPQERDMGRWIRDNGGEDAVLNSDNKCAAMIKYESKLASMVGSTGSAAHEKLATVSEDEAKHLEAKAITALRQEYRADIQGIIQENFESYSKRFKTDLYHISKDLGNRIQHQGDRLIKYLKGGPHSRIKDKMIYHVWKDQVNRTVRTISYLTPPQGWKASADTKLLVLAVQDYFVQRVENSKLSMVSQHVVRKRPTPSVSGDDDDGDDPETDITQPLPDSWMTEYLQVKPLQYLQQAFDPDFSGLTTIPEINSFTRARPQDWSVPRWISYWAIGWQIFATRYCVEIEELFAQMVLLRDKIRILMPGNTRFVNDYIEGTWQHVTALTSAIERYDSPPPWLAEKFSDYVQAQEQILQERLEKIRYNIDAPDIVTFLLRGDPIERSIFPLLTLLMRSHVAKMHLCLQQELDYRELGDDMDTVTWVVYGVWNRFLELKEYFQHQQVSDLKQTFEWLSCGLFKNYWDWEDWLSPKHFMNSSTAAWISFGTIIDLEQSKLTDILTYTEVNRDSQASDSSNSTPTPPLSPVSAENPERASTAAEPSRVEIVEAVSTDKMSVAPSSPTASKPSAAEMSITGKWYGWHWTETRKPYLPMTSLNIECGDRQEYSETETVVTGDGVSIADSAWRLYGTMESANQPQGSLEINFERVYSDDVFTIIYSGHFLYDTQILTGTFERSDAKGSFLFKKVPTSTIMCSRPLAPKLNAKELWSFACNAVVDGLRRNKLGLSYLCQKMTKMRRALEFLYLDDLELLDEAQQAEHAAIQKYFTFEEMTELYKLYFWYDRSVHLQPRGYPCDSCGDTLQRSRVVCLECVSTPQPEHTIDFCPKLDCIASASLPEVTDVAHAPWHLMMKTRDLFLLKDYYTVKQRAQFSLDRAREAYTDATEDVNTPVPLRASHVAPDLGASQETVSVELTLATDVEPSSLIGQQKSAAPAALPLLDAMPPDVTTEPPGSGTTDPVSSPSTPTSEDYEALKCTICAQRVVSPCWYCVDCYSDSWICDSCEKIIDVLPPWDFQKRYRMEVEDPSAHNVFHLLVRVAHAKRDVDADSKEAPPFGQWEHVEKRIQEIVTERFDHVERRLEEVESRLTQQLTAIMNMLSAQRS